MRRSAILFGAVLALALLAAAPAQAKFGLNGFKVTFDEEDGSAATVAGSHPYQATTTFNVNTKPNPDTGEGTPEEDAKNLRFQFPPGFIGSTTAVDQCTSTEFLTVDEEGYPGCPNKTAVGAYQAQVQFPAPAQLFDGPVYNLVPPPGVAAKIGFVVFNTPVTTEIGVNQKPPYNLTASALNVPQVLELLGTSFQIWGTPGDPVHDPYRGRCLANTKVSKYGELISAGICHTGQPETPFLTLPRSCTGPLTSTYEAVSWQQPNAAPDKGSFQAPGMTDCPGIGLSPEIKAKTSTAAADSASAFDFDLSLANEGFAEKGKRSQSDVEKARVTLPAGISVNPSSAVGLAACTKAQYEAETLTSVPGQGCPQASKVGEVEAETPAAAGKVIKGPIYVASQDDNPFNSLIALYIVLREPGLGAFVKLPIKVEPSEEQGPNAGRLVTVLDDAPQVPVSRFSFHFKDGPRAPLVTPSTCGTFNVEAQFSPWSDPSGAVPASAPLTVSSGVGGGPCPVGALPFRPGFGAGSLNNAAGAYSPFDMRFTRQDGDQDITRFDAVLPKGVTAKLAGVGKCPESAIATAKAKSGRAELAAPSCPASSRIGSSLVAAGVGSTLSYVPGSLYLSGPFGGDPLSVISITPAVVGPFDVGTVVVHEALTVDPETAEVKADGSHSEPIPHMLKGIPAKVREVRVQVDRPNFMLNPTSCAVKQAKATLFGSYLDVFSPADDSQVTLTQRYQAANCAALKFKPSLALSLKGAVKRGGHPSLKGVLTYPPGGGYANAAKAVVTLPHSAFLDQSHIRTVCTRVQFAAKQCPAGSIYGKAKAITPLLDEPLEGPVYLRSSSNPLPDLVVALHGAIDVNLVGRIDSVNARIRTSFESAPDAPVSKFTLEMQGGKKGLIVNSRNLCVRKSKAIVALTAQNGKALEQSPVVKASCKKGAKGKGGGGKRG